MLNYFYRHGKQELDLSLSVRFSSLSNNAKLELLKAHTVRVEKEVTIALQVNIKNNSCINSNS